MLIIMMQFIINVPQIASIQNVKNITTYCNYWIINNKLLKRMNNQIKEVFL